MRSSKSALRVATTICASVLLAACGGGGGGGGVSKDATTLEGEARALEKFTGSTTPAPLTSEDQATSMMNAFHEFEPPEIPLSARGGTDTSSQSIARRLAEYASTVRKTLLTDGVPSLVRASEPYAGDCLYGGTFTGTITRSSETSLSKGDSAEITFAACNDDNVSTLNGKVSVRVLGLSGNPDDFEQSSSMTLAFGAVDFSSTTTYGPAVTLNGGYAVSTAWDSNKGLETYRLSGDVLLLESGTDEVLLADFDQWYQDDWANEIERYSDDVSISTNNSNGTLKFDTTKVFVQGWYTPPSEGQLVISGANGAKIRMTVLNMSTYEVALDLDGDGHYEDVREENFM